MRKILIDNFDFYGMEIQKYWQPPASWTDTRRRTEVRNRIFSEDWVGSRKMDGAFYQFIKSMDGEMVLIGRSVSTSGDYLNKIELVPQCHSFFEWVPNGTCFLGEVYLPNKEGAKNTTSIMNCLPAKALARQAKDEDKLHYYIFDCLAWNGRSLMGEETWNRISHVIKLRQTVGENFPFIDFAVYYTGEKLWNQLQTILSDGGEGIVLNNIHALYEPGKRPSKSTMKVKKELQQTIDCIVIGANPPTREYTGKELATWTLWYDTNEGKMLEPAQRYYDFDHGAPIIPVTKNFYNGWCGSWKIGLVDEDGTIRHIGDLSGLTDEMKANWRDYVGKVVEVGGMEVFQDTVGHGIRHPKLIQVREDKEPKECSIKQLEA